MKLPFFPFYPRDYTADTMHLSLAEHGAYLQLMMLCWNSPNCQIPADVTWIMKRLRCTPGEFENHVEPVLKEFFLQSDNGKYLINARLLREYEKASKAYYHRLAGAVATNAKKAKSLNSKGQTTALTVTVSERSPGGEAQSYSHAQSHAHSQSISSGGKDAALPPEASGKRRPKNKGTTLPEDWRLSYDDVERLANKHRVSEETVRKVEGEFKTYWLSRAAEDEKNAAKVSWERTFENDITRKLMIGIIKHRSY